MFLRIKPVLKKPISFMAVSARSHLNRPGLEGGSPIDQLGRLKTLGGQELKKLDKPFQASIARVTAGLNTSKLFTERKAPKLDLNGLQKDTKRPLNLPPFVRAELPMLEKLKSSAKRISSEELNKMLAKKDEMLANKAAQHPDSLIRDLGEAETNRQKAMEPVKKMAGQQEMIQNLVSMTKGLSEWAQKN